MTKSGRKTGALFKWLRVAQIFTKSKNVSAYLIENCLEIVLGTDIFWKKVLSSLCYGQSKLVPSCA